ncbi:MAG TPA: gluconate 2-dehydrogenase subunit 3 family protein [Anaeromyxobacteraceae bacterium]
MARRPPPLSLDMPWDGRGRRSFLVRGLAGGALLALGGAGWFLTRKTRPLPELAGPLKVFSPEEAAIVAAIAGRLVPERPGFPPPAEVRLVSRMDEVVAMAHPATQVELRRLVRLFESALGGLLLDGDGRLFTTSTPARQDRRLTAWAQSRHPLRRTGYRALKRLVYASYYGSPETWAAIGYAGPPLAIPSGDRGGR